MGSPPLPCCQRRSAAADREPVAAGREPAAAGRARRRGPGGPHPAVALLLFGCGDGAELRAGDPRALEAVRYARESLTTEGPQRTFEILEGARSQFPDSLEVAHEFARVAASQSRLEPALGTYLELLDSDPSDGEAARGLLQVALFVGRADHIERAEAALRARPTATAEDLALLSRAAFERGDAEDSLALARRSLALAPDEPETRYRAGAALLELERGAEAAAEFEAALAADPGHGGALFALGTWLLQSDADAVRGAGLLERSEAVRRLRAQAFARAAPDERLRTAREVAKRVPEWSGAWVEAARAQLELGRPKRAETALARAAEARPPHPELTRLRYEAAVASGDHARARALLAEFEEHSKGRRP